MAKPTFKDIPLNTDYLLRLAPVVAGMRAYHHHSTIGMDHIPAGGVIIAANHSLASYDIALLMANIYDYTNRIPRALIDRLFFKVPGLGSVMEALGSREGNRDNAVKMLNDGEMLVIAPGGMREALRPSSEKYRIIWEKRKGFAKLAVETGVPVILAACPGADDLYDVAPSHITAWAYKTFKVPLFFARGVGLSPIPKPVKLTHYLSEPIMPPVKSEDSAEFSKQVDEFHQRLIERMDRLMADSAKQEQVGVSV